MLGGRWRSGGWPAEVHRLLIGGVWVMGWIGLGGYCRNRLGCRLGRSCAGCTG